MSRRADSCLNGFQVSYFLRSLQATANCIKPLRSVFLGQSECNAGVPASSSAALDQKVPPVYSAGISSAAGPDMLTSRKRSSRRFTWSAAALSLLLLLGILYLLLHKWRTGTVSAPLEARGVGESREDFVRVQGTQVHSGPCTFTLKGICISKCSQLLQACIKSMLVPSCQDFEPSFLSNVPCLCLEAQECLMQFMLDCRPFYVAGFNAHDLVPKTLATTSDHKTYGKSSGAYTCNGVHLWNMPLDGKLCSGP